MSESAGASSAALRWLRTRTGLTVVLAVTLGFVGVAVDVPLLQAIATLTLAVAAVGIATALGRANRAIGRLDAAIADASRDRRVLQRTVEEERSANAAATKRLTAASTRADEAIAALRRVTAVEDDKIIDRLRALEQRVTEVDRGVTTGLAAERSTRSLLFARRSPVPPLDRVVALMTVHRSGSTRLHDLVRSHPAVVLDPTMRTWDRLGWQGRRYPAALCDRDDGTVAIEVDHGVGALVPSGSNDLAPPDDPWIVEKGHPQFVDFDAARFAAPIGEMRAEGIRVEVVYGVREPIESMWSMYSYKQRDPRWYAFLDPHDIPDWIARSLETMAAMRTQVDGLVVDFRHHDSDVLRRDLAAFLSPGWSSADVDAWAQTGRHALDPTRRSDGGGVFVGDGSSERSADGPDGLWHDCGEVIARAVAAHRALVGD